MASPAKDRSPFDSPLVIYTLLAAFIFTLGFFIHFGREAHASKSWEYVMPDGDPLYYWSVAKGRMMTPRCDGNPYYYEEQGTRSAIPFTTAEGIGLIAKYTHIPLLWFFPAWQILVPLFTWLIIVICCWKLWRYPLDVSAAVTMILLLSTLFCPWPGIHTTLLRFSRPLDGIAPLFLWISLIFKGNPDDPKHCLAIALVAALTLWLQPFNAVFGLWITAFEYGYSLITERKSFKARLHLYAGGSSIIFGLILASYMYFGKNINSEIIDFTLGLKAPKETAIFCFLMTLCMFAFVASAVCFFIFRLKQKATSLDRFVIGWTLFGVLIYSGLIQAQEPQTHMLYFAIPMMFSLAGWIHEKLCVLKETPYFSHLSYGVTLGAIAFLVFAVFAKKNFFSAISLHYFFYISQYFFILLFSFWLLSKLELVKKALLQKKIIWAIIFFIALTGYWKFPIYAPNRDYPFGGAFQWLKQRAPQNSVVLTASLKYRYCEYLFLKTGLKSYFYTHGAYGGAHKTLPQIYRRNFVTGLLLGKLEYMPDYGEWTLDKKLHALKLDYILIPKPSPFVEAVKAQLREHLQEVYQDQKCLLWKVS